MVSHTDIARLSLHEGEQSLDGVAVKRMEDIEAQGNPVLDAPHRHTYYSLIWIQVAQGTHMIDFETYQLAANQLYIIAPGQVHQLIPSGIPQGWVVLFNKAYLEASGMSARAVYGIYARRSCRMFGPLSVNEVLAQRLAIWIPSMQEILNTHEPARYEMAGALLKASLLACAMHCTEPRDASDPVRGAQMQLVEAFRESVETHIRTYHQVQQYAELHHVSSGYLNELVRDATGSSAKEHITAQLLTEAKRRLAFTALSLKEIAFELGFSEPSHLSHFFKQHAGESASDFRKRQQVFS